MRKLALATLMLGLSIPAQAQIDPAGVAQGAVLSTTMRAHSNRIAKRSGRESSRATMNRTAQTCANVPSVRARLGSNNPKVQELARLCRAAGY